MFGTSRCCPRYASLNRQNPKARRGACRCCAAAPRLRCRRAAGSAWCPGDVECGRPTGFSSVDRIFDTRSGRPNKGSYNVRVVNHQRVYDQSNSRLDLDKMADCVGFKKTNWKHAHADRVCKHVSGRVPTRVQFVRRRLRESLREPFRELLLGQPIAKHAYTNLPSESYPQSGLLARSLRGTR